MTRSLTLVTLLTACTMDTGLTSLRTDELDDARRDLAAAPFRARTLVVALDGADARELAAALDLRLVRHDEATDVAVFLAPEDDLAEALAWTRRWPGIEAAEPDYLAFATASRPNDPLYGRQWNLRAVGAEAAWDRTRGGGVVVAVVDTGVSRTGSDGLFRVLAGRDVVDEDGDPSDPDGHGTHVAGTIAQRTNNGVGVAGVAPEATILPVRVLGEDGSGSYSDIAAGITWAVDQGADVINLSLGGEVGSTSLQRAVRYADQRGVLLVAASGNEAGPVGYPAAYAEVLAVGAHRFDGEVTGYSNTGPQLDLVAPGGDTSVDQDRDGRPDGIWQETLQSGRYQILGWEGTSMATPHVAAAAALLLAVQPDPIRVRAALLDGAEDGGAAGFDTTFGHGRLDIPASLALLDPRPPEEEPTDEPEPEPESPLALSAAKPGDLRITEVMANPSACDDAYSEWIEVENRSANTLDLGDLVLVDEGGNRGRPNLGVILAPGERAVLGRGDGATFCDPAVQPAAYFLSSPALNNSGDRLMILAGSTGKELDRTPIWGSASSGVAWQMDGTGAWCNARTGMSNGQVGTPGKPNTGC